MEIRERPIIFSTEMVRAILDGRKTMTRRVVKPQPCRLFAIWKRYPHQEGCPYGQVGDRLWVRETWQDFCPLWDGAWCGCGSKEMIANTHKIAYKTTNTGINHKDKQNILPEKWRPSIFMPRWASRITLEITEIRVERLREICIADIEAEGIYGNRATHNAPIQQNKFRTLWDSINAQRGYSWESNPWCWCISFKRIGEK